MSDYHKLCPDEGWIYIPEEMEFTDDGDCFELEFCYQLALPITPFAEHRYRTMPWAGTVFYAPETSARHAREDEWWFENNPDYLAEGRPAVIKKSLRTS